MSTPAKTRLPEAAVRSLRGLAKAGRELSVELMDQIETVWSVGIRLLAQAKSLEPKVIDAETAERLSAELGAIAREVRATRDLLRERKSQDFGAIATLNMPISGLDRLIMSIRPTAGPGRPRSVALDLAVGIAVVLIGLGLPRSTPCRLAAPCAREGRHSILYEDIEQRLRRGPRHAVSPISIVDAVGATVTVKSRILASDGLRTRIELESSNTTNVAVAVSESGSGSVDEIVARRLDEIRRLESSLKSQSNASTFELSLVVEARLETENLLGALRDERVSARRLRELLAPHRPSLAIRGGGVSDSVCRVCK